MSLSKYSNDVAAPEPIYLLYKFAMCRGYSKDGNPARIGTTASQRARRDCPSSCPPFLLHATLMMAACHRAPIPDPYLCAHFLPIGPIWRHITFM